MDVTHIEQLARLRTVVGYLGERDQHAWWQSSFFATNSRAFLTPVFGRTPLLVQCVGVTRAAAVLHDERIGVGQVYHLFRLPEDVEQRLHHVLRQPYLWTSISPLVANKEGARDFLHRSATSGARAVVGPTRVGDAHDLRDAGLWAIVAAYYAHAFEQDAQVFPYFVDKV